MSKQPTWTPQQARAIEARGHTVLVSAAAGSGKTAVLTERAVQRMLDGQDPIPADRLLVVTFTRAAAREMKQRMVARLAERIAACLLYTSAALPDVRGGGRTDSGDRPAQPRGFGGPQRRP